ncbi:MAG: phosphatidate cytidylyltransferase [Fusobacteriaceae bacterium]
MFSRILVGIIWIPILIFVYNGAGLPLVLFATAGNVVAQIEFYGMIEHSKKQTYKATGIIIGASLPGFLYFNQILEWGLTPFVIIAPYLMCLLAYRVVRGKVERTTEAVGTTMLGILYFPVLYSYIVLIGLLPNGGKWVLSTQILAWTCDIAAYFVGMTCGKKIFKNGLNKISPKKSYEGAIGGMIATCIVLVIIGKAFKLFPESVSMLHIILMGVILSVVMVMGDLVESLLKRELDIKDSGKFLGGHGGLLDRFDSIIFMMPVVYYFVKYTL